MDPFNDISNVITGEYYGFDKFNLLLRHNVFSSDMSNCKILKKNTTVFIFTSIKIGQLEFFLMFFLISLSQRIKMVMSLEISKNH